jgi:hypothetical protein
MYTHDSLQNVDMLKSHFAATGGAVRDCRRSQMGAWPYYPKNGWFCLTRWAIFVSQNSFQARLASPPFLCSQPRGCNIDEGTGIAHNVMRLSQGADMEHATQTRRIL